MMKKEIKNIVFDMGQVLLHFTVERLLTRFFDEGDHPLLRQIIFGSGDWRAIDEGTLTEEEALRRWQETAPERLREPLADMLAHWEEILTPVEGMADLVRSLKAAGYGCYLLSNTSLRFYRYWESVEALRLLDARFVSAEHRMLKPDPAIFRKMLADFGLCAEECYFIDDSEENTEAARSVGMTAFCFAAQDVEALRADMRGKGIRV